MTASDGREGFLQLTLNVSGRNGMPSADDLVYSLYDDSNNKLFDQNLFTQGTELRQAAISIKRPPGWCHYMTVVYLSWTIDADKLTRAC